MSLERADCADIETHRMKEQSGARLVLDSKNSWRNLPYALMPGFVGVGLIVYPWVGVLDPAMTAPIMLPFGIVWIVIALCINSYQSELILDQDEGSVNYRTSLWLHSWCNKAVRGNVPRVVLKKEGGHHSFVVELEEGEDIRVTTFDYWRSREWSEHVAAFLGVPLVDECRDEDAVSAEALNLPLLEQDWQLERPGDAPGKIEMVWEGDKKATISIPPRGILPSARLRVVFAAGFVALALVAPLWGWHPAVSLPALLVAAFLCYRPLIQATHKEVISVSPRGLMVEIIRFGRSTRKSLALHEIRSLTAIKGNDARFEHEEFDRQAVCVESIEGVDTHLQLGSHLPKFQHVEWLRNALLFVMTSPGGRGLEVPAARQR